MVISETSRTFVVVAIAVVAVATTVFIRFMSFSPELPEELVVKTLNSVNRKGGKDSQPLFGQVVILTGGTSGIGKSLASLLYKFGATVIITSRDLKRGQETEKSLQQLHPESTGKIEAFELDTADLSSVVKFAEAFKSTHTTLHTLVNNAGIHYGSLVPSPLENLSIDASSKQNYDLLFATNYLGHFLLTDLLLPELSETGKRELESGGRASRVVNIASGYHAQSDGQMLKASGTVGPIAALAVIDSSMKWLHRELSYANSKLAQILHTKELTRRLMVINNTYVKAVSVCPGWVATSILPDNLIGRFVSGLAYSPSAGCLSPICAMYVPQLSGGEFITNYVNSWLEGKWGPWILSKLPGAKVRAAVGHILSMWILTFQRSSYGWYASSSSPESYDEGLARGLFDWSSDAVKQFTQKRPSLLSK